MIGGEGGGNESLWKRFIGVVSDEKWNEVKWSMGGERVFMEEVYRSSKWWEVKDWGESVSELMIVKKQLQETVHSTVLLGCSYLLYML